MDKNKDGGTGIGMDAWTEMMDNLDSGWKEWRWNGMEEGRIRK